MNFLSRLGRSDYIIRLIAFLLQRLFLPPTLRSSFVSANRHKFLFSLRFWSWVYLHHLLGRVVSLGLDQFLLLIFINVAYMTRDCHYLIKVPIGRSWFRLFSFRYCSFVGGNFACFGFNCPVFNFCSSCLRMKVELFKNFNVLVALHKWAILRAMGRCIWEILMALRLFWQCMRRTALLGS